MNETKNLGDEVKENAKLPFIIKFTFGFLSVLLTFVSIMGKLLLRIYDILVPRSLRELVPILNMFRKYILLAAELMSGKKSKEIYEVANELEEIRMKEDKVMKNYPIRRGIGEVINLSLHPVVMTVIPVAIVGKDLEDILAQIGIPSPWGILLFGTGVLAISWLATIFGPIYALFHRCSQIMLRRGAYRWAEIFQDLENLFSLPFYTAKSSFSILDTPPVSSETYEEFKLEIVEDLNQMKSRVADLLSLDSHQVPERSKKMLEELLHKTQKPLGKLDVSKITEETARNFALLIWNKEGSLFGRDKAVEMFAERNQMSVEEARQSLELIALKTKEGFTSKDLYFCIMLTGSLKGIAAQEDKYNQFLSDVEYNSLALSLTLGAKQYLIDRFVAQPVSQKYGRMLVNSLLALGMPFYVFLTAILGYFWHIIVYTGKSLSSIRNLVIGRLVGSRFSEIYTTFTDSYISLGQKRISLKDMFDIDWSATFKAIGKFLMKLILIIPLLILAVFKAVYRPIKKLWTRRTEEEKLRRNFERELATEALAAMYQELYEKMILGDESGHCVV